MCFILDSYWVFANMYRRNVATFHFQHRNTVGWLGSRMVSWTKAQKGLGSNCSRDAVG